MTSYLNWIGWNFHQISKWLYFTAMAVLVKIKNYSWCRHCKLNKQELFCFFRKSNLCVCRNLPQRFHRACNCNYIFSTWSSADKSSLKINFLWKRSKRCDMRHLRHSQSAKLTATCLIRFHAFATSYDPMSISGQSWG